jgi:hypothetical protein
VLKGLLLNPFSLGHHSGIAYKEHIGWGHVVQRFMIALVVVVAHKTGNGLFQFGWRIVQVEFDKRLHRAMVALDLALGLGMVGCAANVVHLVMLEILFQRIRNKGRAIIRQQPGAMANFDVLDTRFCHGDIEGFLDIGAAHGGSQSPGEDVARIVVQHGAEIVIAPIDDLELSEVGLPQFVDPVGRIYPWRSRSETPDW